MTIAVQAISRGEGRPRTGTPANPCHAAGIAYCAAKRCHDGERGRGTPPSPQTRPCARFRPSQSLRRESGIPARLGGKLAQGRVVQQKLHRLQEAVRAAAGTSTRIVTSDCRQLRHLY